jgi:hypothetical protein
MCVGALYLYHSDAPPREASSVEYEQVRTNAERVEVELSPAGPMSTEWS